MVLFMFAEEDLPDISFTRTDIQARDDDYCNVEFKTSVSHLTNSFWTSYGIYYADTSFKL